MSYQLKQGCEKAMDTIYEYFGEDYIPFFERLSLQVHLFFCPACAEQTRKLEEINSMLHSDFIHVPSFENRIMERINNEVLPELDDAETVPEVPGGISFRAWVIVGFFILVSLAASFFGMDFIEAASIHDPSFVLPFGIISGIVLTGYGALFIGSHLKELSSHFKLH